MRSRIHLLQTTQVASPEPILFQTIYEKKPIMVTLVVCVVVCSCAWFFSVAIQRFILLDFPYENTPGTLVLGISSWSLVRGLVLGGGCCVFVSPPGREVAASHGQSSVSEGNAAPKQPETVPSWIG